MPRVFNKTPEDLLENFKMFISITYEVWTEEDVEIGEPSDRGFQVEDEAWTLEEIVRELESGYAHPSASVPSKYSFISMDEEMNYRTGEHTSYSMHFSEKNKDPLAAKFWVQMLTAASKGKISSWKPEFKQFKKPPTSKSFVKRANVTPKMLRSYLETALWSSVDPDTEKPLDRYHGVESFTLAFQKVAKQDLKDFVEMAESKGLLENWKDGDIGHNFWLSRNGHGAGFFDFSGPQYNGDQLQRLAKQFGSIDLYVTDDGEIEGI